MSRNNNICNVKMLSIFFTENLTQLPNCREVLDSLDKWKMNLQTVVYSQIQGTNKTTKSRWRNIHFNLTPGPRGRPNMETNHMTKTGSPNTKT